MDTTTTTPMLASARAVARRVTPRKALRALPVVDLEYNAIVAAGCERYIVGAARSWIPQGRRTR